MIVECEVLDENTETIATSLLIYPTGFQDFEAYLDFLDMAELLLQKQGYEGVYQVASFHPNYCFAGEATTDAANYTNRSPYPMLHLLRESSLTAAIDTHADTEKIPLQNIAFARKKGAAAMQALLQAAING